MKTLGILTSGGDCAGLNIAVKAATHRAILNYGAKVIGIKQGSNGLFARPVNCMELTLDSFDGFIERNGGTFLGTINRGDPFNYAMEDGSRQDISPDIIAGYNLLGLDGLIVVGGDGSFGIMQKMQQLSEDFKFIGIPKTIDNDVHGTDNAIGFATAVEVATSALDKLQPTAASHNRVMIMEVMGRDAGFIALHSGIAGNADIILIPELTYSIEGIKNKILERVNSGKNFSLVVVAESVTKEDGEPIKTQHSHNQIRYGGIGDYLAHTISQSTNAETRVTTLGHVQRGASPCPADRLLAAQFGVHAVDLAMNGKSGRMVAIQNNKITDIDVNEVVAKTQTVARDNNLIQVAVNLGIYVGDL